jgi:hypothetical protein
MKDDLSPPEGLQALSDQLGPTTRSQPPNADRERTETSGDVEIKDAVNPDLRGKEINNTSTQEPTQFDHPEAEYNWHTNPGREVVMGQSADALVVLPNSPRAKY